MLHHRAPLQDMSWKRSESRSQVVVAALVLSFGLALAGAALLFGEVNPW